ncbi:hypothetical protein Pint_01932 [Pistacia integerrima]|uniref:Uncharacterized protein n=1 Tax=Pistacia integerrima TaxID=434235 RepID=A0ACC0ZKT8_9ROSI|nr:hypothetical protein Pint_01932 [Pistacia integerrima]
MKKLNRKGKVHPSPAPHLTLLPATILTLAATLSPEDKQVLAYLLSCSGCTNATTADNFNKTAQKSSVRVDGGGGDHVPIFECNCFRCYMSFWARWDTSPNRQLIHEIIEAYEEGLVKEKKTLKKKKRGNSRKKVSDESKDGGSSVEMSCGCGADAAAASEDLDLVGGGEDGDKVDLEKGSLRKIVSFLGERILGFWA